MAYKYWTIQWDISMLKVGESIHVPLTGPKSIHSFLSKLRPKRFRVSGRVVTRIVDGDYQLNRSRKKDGKVVDKRRGVRSG